MTHAMTKDASSVTSIGNVTSTTTTMPLATTSVVVYAPAKTISGTDDDDDRDDARWRESVRQARRVHAASGATTTADGTTTRGAAMNCGTSSSASSSSSSGRIETRAIGEWLIAAHGIGAKEVVERVERACATATTSAGRVEAMRAATAAMAEASPTRGFAVCAYDGANARGFAARHKRSMAVRYGYDARGALVLTLGGDFADAALGLEELKPGRFVYGHGYVKPMEYGSFWASARSTFAGSPAKSATGDASSRPRASPTRVVVSNANATMTAPKAFKAPSPGAYVPPALRARAEALAREEQTAARVEEARRKSEAIDREIAATLHNQERLVSALGGALASALVKAASRASFSTDDAATAALRFHAARQSRRAMETASSFYAPSPTPAALESAAPTSSVARASLDACARVSADARRASSDARLHRGVRRFDSFRRAGY